MKYDYQYIESITKFRKRLRIELHRYYYRLPEEEQVRTFKYQVELMKNNRDKRIKNKDADFHYAMFLIAVNALHNLEYATSKKNYDANGIELERIQSIRANRIKSLKKKKPSKLSTIIEIQFFELIKRLRGEHLSWRDISRYITKYHRTKISHEYLCRLYKEIEEHKG